jgi:hypothetical protein
MAGRVGSRLDKGLSLAGVERPLRAPKAGTYQNKERGGGQFGGTTYPSVLEAYNRDSDYKRWRAGLDYWQGSGKSWGDLERFYLLRSFRDFGARPGPQLASVVYFPSSSSPDGAWTVVCRRRGALILPQPLRQADITLDTSYASEQQHRLSLDVSSSLSSAQIEAWKAFIGDQFEDSATGTEYPAGLIEEPIDTIAYTLVEVDPAGGRLLFDLSRPYMRRRPNPLRPRAFWQKILYNRQLPLSWRNDGSRYLCSSHRLYCSCPDFSGRAIADLTGGSSGSQSRFPRPSAGRTISGRAEADAAGYSRSWRDLSLRSDQRRECKHIHAMRWSLDYPFYEPSDYEVGKSDRHFQGASGGTLSSEEIFRYHKLREFTVDRLAVALADSAGIAIDARDSIPSDDTAPAQPGRAPILWTSEREPEPFRALTDDWWVQRGTDVLRVFDPALQRFVEFKTVGGEQKPVIELVAAGSLIPPEISGARGMALAIEITLQGGLASGEAVATGAVLTIGTALQSGVASVDASTTGAALVLGTALQAGAASVGVVATGAILTIETALQSGAVSVSAGAAGAALVVGTTLQTGQASGGALAAGASWTIETALQSGAASVSTSAAGAALAVGTTLQAGSASGEAAAAGFGIAVALSMSAGAADSGFASGFGIAAIEFTLSDTPVGTTHGVFAVGTVNDSATLQLLMPAVAFAESATPAGTTLSVFAVGTVNDSATLQLLVTPVDLL